VIVLIAATLGGGDSNSDGDGSSGGASTSAGHAKPGHDTVHVPKSYVVENGDTLTSIAHKTGVPVHRILQLNPGVDPQILISGEELKLR
jgi:LysM repeat protein